MVLVKNIRAAFAAATSELKGTSSDWATQQTALLGTLDSANKCKAAWDTATLCDSLTCPSGSFSFLSKVQNEFCENLQSDKGHYRDLLSTAGTLARKRLEEATKETKRNTLGFASTNKGKRMMCRLLGPLVKAAGWTLMLTGGLATFGVGATGLISYVAAFAAGLALTAGGMVTALSISGVFGIFFYIFGETKMIEKLFEGGKSGVIYTASAVGSTGMIAGLAAFKAAIALTTAIEQVGIKLSLLGSEMIRMGETGQWMTAEEVAGYAKEPLEELEKKNSQKGAIADKD